MINFTGNVHLDMMCSCCTDKNNARAKINSARRILNNLERTVNTKELIPFMNTREHSEFLRKLSNSHNHIHFMCGTCRQININELHTIENEINNYLGALLLYIQSIEKTKAYALKSDLFDLTRGHYPIAARLIDNIKVEREDN